MFIDTRFFGMSAAIATIALSGCQPVETPVTPAPVEVTQSCKPYSLVNDRLRASIPGGGLGMDICSDGSVVNWDGNHVGQVKSVQGKQVTIHWPDGGGGGGFSGTDTVEATLLQCRQSGELRNCP